MPENQLSLIVNRLKTDGAVLVQDLKALAAAELVPSAKHAGAGGGMFGGAGYLALNAVSLLFLAGAGGFALLFTDVAGLGVLLGVVLGLVAMAILLLLIAAILALVGKKQIDKVKPPEATIAEAKATLEALKASAQQGRTVVQSGAIDSTSNTHARRALR